MKNTKTSNKVTGTNNVIVTFEWNDKTFCGRYKTKENALKAINSNKWNSPKNLGWKVVDIKEV